MISCGWTELFLFLWGAIHFSFSDSLNGAPTSHLHHFDHNSRQVHAIAAPRVSACAPRAVVPWAGGTDKSGQKEGVERSKEDKRGAKEEDDKRVG